MFSFVLSMRFCSKTAMRNMPCHSYESRQEQMAQGQEFAVGSRINQQLWLLLYSLIQNQGHSLCPIFKSAYTKMAPLDQFGVFCSHSEGVEGYTSSAWTCKWFVARGYWQTCKYLWQYSPAWGRERRRWRNECEEADMMLLLSFVCVAGPDNS